MEKKFNVVYQTKNLVNGKTYVGVHSTDNLDDGYLGCGNTRTRVSHRDSVIKRAILKHGVDNFISIPMDFFDTAKEAYEEEKWLVDKKWIKSKDNYNVALGGQGGIRNQAHRNAISASNKINKTGKPTWNTGTKGICKANSGSFKEGNTPPMRYKVLNTETGEVYPSMTIAAYDFGLTPSSLSARLNGKVKNNTLLMKLQ